MTRHDAIAALTDEANSVAEQLISFASAPELAKHSQSTIARLQRFRGALLIAIEDMNRISEQELAR